MLAGAAAAPPQPAPPPTLRTEARCYAPGPGAVAYRGSGLRAGARYGVALDGRRVGGGRVGPTGRIAGHLDVPAPQGARARAHLRASDGARSASTSFLVSRTSAALVPAGRAGRVRLLLRGLGAGSPTPQPIFLHYLAPGGGPFATVRLGPGRGPCGDLRTPPRRLFPFHPRPGRWRLRFDTHRAYRRGGLGPAATLAVPVVRARSS